MNWRHAILVTTLIVVCVMVGITGVAQQSAQRSPDADWPTYNRDLAGTRYSPLTQINTANVGSLKQVWSYRLRPAAGASVPAVDRPASAAEISRNERRPPFSGTRATLGFRCPVKISLTLLEQVFWPGWADHSQGKSHAKSGRGNSRARLPPLGRRWATRRKGESPLDACSIRNSRGVSRKPCCG